ncbi:hypothetical protein E7T06_19115 [Deinococcus sp. Arct2-2]|uniref:hypothetical protein n=1 Tax=Deinococcus sp. Arct2-2 TaxID=2568653 RepID=UPI0010A35F91|nr:hypothetical protein [Deinococcus sp. Arct2-2]THF67829.1 hypothetical protein E7T06_19115 [Deinococcus sp. Arct2-2]
MTAQRPTLETLLLEARARLLGRAVLPEVFAGRGFTPDALRQLELGLDKDENAVIALRNPAGQLVGLKLRLLRPDRHKYREIPEDNGNPPWFAPGSDQVSAATYRGVLCVEGEFNAMLTHLALSGTDARHERWAVVGLGSTFGPVPWAWLAFLGLPVVFALDPGRLANKQFLLWQAQAEALGLNIQRAAPLLGDWDAGEYAEACGVEALRARTLQLLPAF